LDVDGHDRAILKILSSSSELTVAHMARRMEDAPSPDELERRLFELAARGLVEHEELDTAPAVPNGHPLPAVKRYWKITYAGRNALESAADDICS
jgi:hypothetical protein